jgi:aminoglycoside phosphotransferase (APT) family kinase protein
MDAASLDIENRADCERYLVAAGHCRAGEVTEHKVLAGGVSSRTVLVAFTDGRRWVLKQSLAKLRVAADWFSDPRRIHREALGMRVLGELAPPGSIPKLIFDDETHHVLGMEAVPEPHENWKAMLLAGKIHDFHAFDFARLLAAIHVHSRNRQRELRPLFQDASYFETLRVEPYYEYVAAREPDAAEFLRSLIADTAAHRDTLVHGDYSPKNVLVYHKQLILLDHEVIHWGDPAFDVGFSLTHLLSKAHHLRSPRMHNLAWNYWNVYFGETAKAWLPDIEPDFEAFLSRVVRHTLGCLLARVAGRSPLEYLSADERARQREAVLRLMQSAPDEPKELIARFGKEVHVCP